ncbi:MAG: ferritin family protein [candidate division Zixibacteria bacterium]|nr:ferritin family protein [candidate division Zixibacteria bacterium]NIR68300.1 ferritin family protein [candidate division Zixibacteria bacterium]NIS18274.1 ferritin family protein [candidate division Zixibacteria bacterium]NIS49466.1 ferritin family protein [candidate division Zixibacteria bacterium]NIT54582.1 ferritin family protein [candidate division Zixibacteria bacterium]
MNFNSVDEILDFAIGKEEEAAEFYTELAGKVSKPNIKEMFEQFAREEKGHKAKLLAAKQGKVLQKSEKKILDLKIGDHLELVELTPNIDFQDALILAMKAEKNAFKLYNALAEQADDPAIRDMLLALAQEEAKHKLRFETEYDELVFTEN